MPGPAPRGPGKTRRRNTEIWTPLPAEGRREPAPKLPERQVLDRDGDLRSVPWQPSTLEWWTTVWASPMATQWSPADVPSLVRLAVLIDDCMVTADPRTGAEIRQLEDRFGLSPQARLKLRWVIGESAEASAEASGDALPAAAADASRATAVADDASRPDPRRLRMLPGGA